MKFLLYFVNLLLVLASNIYFSKRISELLDFNALFNDKTFNRVLTEQKTDLEIFDNLIIQLNKIITDMILELNLYFQIIYLDEKFCANNISFETIDTTYIDIVFNHIIASINFECLTKSYQIKDLLIVAHKRYFEDIKLIKKTFNEKQASANCIEKDFINISLRFNIDDKEKSNSLNLNYVDEQALIKDDFVIINPLHFSCNSNACELQENLRYCNFINLIQNKKNILDKNKIQLDNELKNDNSDFTDIEEINNQFLKTVIDADSYDFNVLIPTYKNIFFAMIKLQGKCQNILNMFERHVINQLDINYKILQKSFFDKILNINTSDLELLDKNFNNATKLNKYHARRVFKNLKAVIILL